MQTLLGQFYSKIRGSQEDIASESLVYILSRSEIARDEFVKQINIRTAKNFGDINFSSQSIGENLERPDISGVNHSGNEVLLIEAKFWASLTSNQPVEYLNRLGKDTALVFLVPSLRERPVFEEIVRKLENENLEIETDTNKRSVNIINENKLTVVVSWNDLLEPVREVLEHSDDDELYSDVIQLIGFCDTIDSEAFIPLSDEDLSALHAKRIVSYVEITDKVVDELNNKHEVVSTKGLNKTSLRYGYRRYFSFNRFGMAIDFNPELWSEYADTPLWLYITATNEKGEWVKDPILNNKLKVAAQNLNTSYVLHNNNNYIALHLPIGEIEDEVIDQLAKQVGNLMGKLE